MRTKEKKLPSALRFDSFDEERIDRYLARLLPDFSRTYFQKLIQARSIIVDQHPVSAHHLLKHGQVISIQWPSLRPAVSARSLGPLPFPILYEDDELLVINKPAGLLCHPAGSHGRGQSVVDLLAHKLLSKGWPADLRPGLVHRLDRDTSGVLIFAKNPDTHAKIAKQFLDRQIKKVYRALVKGVVKPNSGVLEGKIARDPFRRNIFAISAEGRHSITEFSVLERWKHASYLQLHPLTGRTHQLRVQLSWFHHPVLGDPFYGGTGLSFEFVKRQMLHAAEIEFMHPEKKKKIHVKAPLPADFQHCVKVLRLAP